MIEAGVMPITVATRILVVSPRYQLHSEISQ